MSFIISGDTHGMIDVGKIVDFFYEHEGEYTSEDYLITVSYTHLTLPTNVDIWNGGKVHFIENRIIHLMRGQVYEIDGTRFFTFGGAYSIDKLYRTEGITWFPEEIPNREEYEEGWHNLEKVDFQVDYILTHSGPREVVAAMGYGELSDDEVELRQYFQRIADNTDFTAWYFGHFHEDTEIDSRFYCLYEDIVVL